MLKPPTDGRQGGNRPTGLSLVEVLIGISCFMLAVLPIATLFSRSLDRSKVIKERFQTFSAAREILSQIQAFPDDALPWNAMVAEFPPEGGFQVIKAAPPEGKLVLGPLSDAFTRKLEVTPLGSGTMRITVSVACPKNPRADLEFFHHRQRAWSTQP